MRAAHWPENEEQALAEARRRLGPTADVHTNPFQWRSPCRITVLRAEPHGARRVVVASGLTWERAFLSLEKRERREATRAPQSRHEKPLRPFNYPQGTLGI